MDKLMQSEVLIFEFLYLYVHKVIGYLVEKL